MIAVWVGRDDNTPLPARSTGASAAAPIAARIIEAAERSGLAKGFSLTGTGDWPPRLLEAGYAPGIPSAQADALVFEPDPEARRRAMEAGGDPFKNPQDLFERIRSRTDPVEAPDEPQIDPWSDRPVDDPWSERPAEDPLDAFSPD